MWQYVWAWAQILELGEFDLQLPGLALGALGKDIQNQLAAVHNLEPQDFFEIALLGRGQVVVKNHHSGVRGDAQLLDLGQLAAADIRGRLHTVAQHLAHLTGHLQAGRMTQPGQFVQGLVESKGAAGRARPRFNTDQHGALGPGHSPVLTTVSVADARHSLDQFRGSAERRHPSAKDILDRRQHGPGRGNAQGLGQGDNRLAVIGPQQV